MTPKVGPKKFVACSKDLQHFETRSHGRKCIKMILETFETTAALKVKAWPRSGVISYVVKKSIWNFNSVEVDYAASVDWVAALNLQRQIVDIILNKNVHLLYSCYESVSCKY